MSHKTELQRELLDISEKAENGTATDRDIQRKNDIKNLLKSFGKPAITPDGRYYNQQQDPDRFSSLGEQLAAAARAAMGGSVDPRLSMESRAATGLSESVPSDGGYLVQNDFSNDLLKAAFETGILAKRCREIGLSSNSNRLEINGIDETSRASGSRWGGIQSYWLDEASTLTASKPKFRKLKFKLHKLIGLCYATDEMLADS